MSIDDPDGRIRLAHGIDRSEPVNEQFANYVQSTAFSMSLSRNMVNALVGLRDAINQRHEMRRRPMHEGALHALERRGLIQRITAPRDWPGWTPGRTASERSKFEQSIRWDQTAAITRAGELTILLMVEAGMISNVVTQMPPPPPGWSDPRPKIDIGGTLLATRRTT